MSFMDGRTEVERVGFRWFLKSENLIDYAILNHAGVWEPYSTAVVQRIVKPGWRCLDVGANLGYYTLLLSRLVGPTGHVHAFEPMAEVRDLLVRHVEMNGIANATIHSAALGDQRSEVEAIRPYNFTMDRQSASVDEPTLIVTCRLDEYHDVGKTDFMKIDVDGHDFQVLRGAEALIDAQHPAILIEIGDSTLRKVERAHDEPYVSGDCTREIMVWLYGKGYDFFYEYDLQPCPSPADLLALVDLSKFTTNLLCLPRGTTP